MTRTTTRQLVMMVGLIGATVALRLYFRHIPNFAPVAAVALFSGYVFASPWMALTVPVTSMLITDQFLGGYQPLLMVTVYGLLAMPVLMRAWLRQSFALADRSALAATSGLLVCTLSASVLFFLITNLVTWYVTPWYPRTATGLWQCYVSAVPFFRYTLAGDVVFGTFLFGSYAAHAAWAERRLAKGAGRSCAA